MDIRYAIHPDHLERMNTTEIRKHLLIDRLFEKNLINLTYSHVDRIIAGGAHPITDNLELKAAKELGVDFFLQRREAGIINIGGRGSVIVDGSEYELDKKECLYIGMGAKDVRFRSKTADSPARFYINSAPAHSTYPTIKLTQKDANRVVLGSAEKSNSRTIYQYIHPKVMQSCQLVMGMTSLEPGSMWNTMPSHTHDRRMEVYCYFDLPADSVVVHLFGKPGETRHIIMRNEQAVISPSWSIHSGVGTNSYTFIWGMVGENQTFTDMDDVPMSQLM